MNIQVTERGRNLITWLIPHIRLMDVKRIGFQLSGCYGKEAIAEVSKPKGGFFKDRQQSDLEHCAGCMYLIIGLSIFYPEIFTPLSKAEAARYGGERSVFKLLMRLLGDHELGELKSGDIASDGTRDEAKKDQEELEFVMDLCKLCKIPSEDLALIVTLFKEMQEKSSRLGKTGYLIDKVDAVLFNLYLESIGKTGWTNAKPNVTELDLKAYGITKDMRAADIWLCNMLITNPQLVLFEFTKLFLEIVVSFAADVRDNPNPMPWLNPLVDKLRTQELSKKPA